MNKTDEKEQLAVHIILAASDFAKIKMEKSPRVEKMREPFAELTKMGWVMVAPGGEKYIRKPQLVIMKNCVVLISWVYKKTITIMMNLCLINSKNNRIEATRAGMRQGSFGGKITNPWEITNVGVWAD